MAVTTGVDGKIYVIAGYTNGATGAGVQMYDVATQTWTTRAAMPQPDADLVAVRIGPLIYAIGGDYGTTKVRAYSSLGDTW
jgi:hypothetical protein